MIPTQTTENTVLAVDLDGTLIRSDLLLESWWNVLSRDVVGALSSLKALPEGKAAFKGGLASSARIDPATLPYNDAVLALVRAHREAGGKAVLVTAADHMLADAIAEHLGCFDEVHASDGVRNLKGKTKASFLTGRYGMKGFDYIGDSSADLAVWEAARRAITVDASLNLQRDVAAVSSGVRHLGTPPVRTRIWLRACRPHQWAKNVLIFLPAVLSHSTDPWAWLAAVLAFAIFSMVASGVYLMNDLLDLSVDRNHPHKRFRPLPSGDMALLEGSLLAVALLTTGFLLAALLLPGRFLLVLGIYILLTAAYSLTLKRRLVIDICTLAALYTLRIIAGAAAIAILPSPWLLAFSTFLFLSLAAVKRQTELISDFAGGRDRKTGRAYQIDDIPIISGMAISAGYVAVLVMALYVNSPDVSQLYASPLILWGICPVLLYWISRIVMITHRGHMNDDPVVFALKDPVSWTCGIIVVAIVIVGTHF